MATVTKQIGGYGTDVKFEIDYDDGNMRMTAFRCINNSGQAAWGMATHVESRRSYDMRFPPNATTEINIPTGPAQRLDLYVNASGKLDGVEYRTMWPYP